VFGAINRANYVNTKAARREMHIFFQITIESKARIISDEFEWSDFLHNGIDVRFGVKRTRYGSIASLTHNGLGTENAVLTLAMASALR
jgi:hypothetical protein